MTPRSQCRECGRRLYPSEVRHRQARCLTCRAGKLCGNCYTRYRGPHCPACAVHGPLQLTNNHGDGPPPPDLAERMSTYAERAAARVPMFQE